MIDAKGVGCNIFLSLLQHLGEKRHWSSFVLPHKPAPTMRFFSTIVRWITNRLSDPSSGKKDARHFVRFTDLKHSISMFYVVVDRPQLARDWQEYSDTDAIGVPIPSSPQHLPFLPTSASPPARVDKMPGILYALPA